MISGYECVKRNLPVQAELLPMSIVEHRDTDKGSEGSRCV